MSYHDKREASIRGFIARRLVKNESVPLPDVIRWAGTRGIQEAEVVRTVKRVLESSRLRRRDPSPHTKGG